MYAYFASLFIKIFGTYNTLIVRIPALIFSVIEVIVAYLLIKEFKSKDYANKVLVLKNEQEYPTKIEDKYNLSTTIFKKSV